MMMLIMMIVVDYDDKSQATPHITDRNEGRSCSSSSSVSCLPDFSLEATRCTWSYTRSSYPSYYYCASTAAVQSGLELLDEAQDTMMMIPPPLLMQW